MIAVSLNGHCGRLVPRQLEGLLRTRGFPALIRRALSSLDRTLLVCRRAPELKTDPDIQVAEAAVQVVEELERNAGDGEEKPALAS